MRPQTEPVNGKNGILIRCDCPNTGTPFYRGRDGYWSRKPEATNAPFASLSQAASAADWENQ